MQGEDGFPLSQRTVQAISERFERICRDQGLTLLTRAADKHGSVVWEAGRASDLNRFLMLGLTPVESVDLPADLRLGPDRHDLPEKHGASVILADATVGADDDRRFVNRIACRWLYGSDEAVQRDLDTPIFDNRILVAWQQANAITDGELIEEYLVPHTRRHAARLVPG